MYKKYSSLIIVVLSFICLTFSVKEVSAQDLDFSVEAKHPENQIDPSKTYFDLLMTPGSTQDLEVVLQNHLNEEMTLLINVNDAVTNDNGIIDYTENKPDLDVTLIHPFDQIATTDKEVVLQPNESKIVKVHLQMPKDPIDGSILGGLHFIRKDGEKNSDGKKQVQLENKFAYVLGVRLSENENPVKKELKLKKVQPGQKNARNMILATLQNPSSRIVGKMKIAAQVYRSKNLSEPIYKNEKENMNMAPNSHFHYAISTDQQDFQPGKYLLKMQVDSNGQKWNFEQPFEINKQEATKLNQQAVHKAQKNNDFLYYLIGFIILLLIIIILLFLLFRQSKQKRTKRKR